MSIAAKSRVSEEEFLSLPQSMDRVELLDGEVIVSPSPDFWHQEILGRVYEALRTWARAQPNAVTVVQAPLDVRFGANRVLQPDVMVFLAPLARDQRGPVARIPEICVEVLSSDRAYDRVTKRFVYGAAGVGEYWIVDPAGHVERRTGPGLAAEEIITDRLSTPVLPGFELDVRALLADETGSIQRPRAR